MNKFKKCLVVTRSGLPVFDSDSKSDCTAFIEKAVSDGAEVGFFSCISLKHWKLFYSESDFPNIGSLSDSVSDVLKSLPSGWSIGFSADSPSGYFVSPSGLIYDKQGSFLIPRSESADCIPLKFA